MFWKQKNKFEAVELDEIFLDSRNLPDFRKESFDGVVESPIGRSRALWLSGIFGIICLIFVLRIFFLDVLMGEEFLTRSEINRLRVVYEDIERGIIYDRHGEILTKNEEVGGQLLRIYPEKSFLHVLGFLSKAEPHPESKNLGVGASGLEASYEAVLRGRPSKEIEEIDNSGKVLGRGFLERGEAGRSLLVSLDKNLQLKLSEEIKARAVSGGFSGGAGILMDINTGEILALASVPEFDPNILSGGAEDAEIRGLLNDKGHPFLNRAISGLYPPGSIVKLVIAGGALNENIIDPAKKILSTGSISLQNPYDASHPNIFWDWKAHGWVDMKEAIAYSSNVYFYSIGGGFGDQKGLGVKKIKEYLKLFGFGELTGIDLLEEKSGYLPDENNKIGARNWSIGDTYNLSIGQGDIVVTPLQMAVYASALASGGAMSYPHIVIAIVDEKKNTIEKFSYPSKKQIIFSEDIFKILRESMREAVLSGTANGLAGFPIEIAAKTGTAEIGDTGKVHSWSIGFFPYKDPKVAFVVLMEAGSKNNLVGATSVVAEVMRWIVDTGFLSKLKNDII